MKIYPHSGDDKKKKKKKGDAPEKKTNLQITERGVVAVQQFNLDIADQEFMSSSVPPAAASPPLCAWLPAWRRSAKASSSSTARS